MENSLHNSGVGTVSKEKLVDDLKVLVRDAEDLVKSTAGTVAEKTREELRVALDRLKASSRRVEERAMVGADATDAIIRKHPYESIGVAFGIGLLIGVLVHR